MRRAVMRRAVMRRAVMRRVVMRRVVVRRAVVRRAEMRRGGRDGDGQPPGGWVTKSDADCNQESGFLMNQLLWRRELKCEEVDGMMSQATGT
jgi:hypothetical protein